MDFIQKVIDYFKDNMPLSIILAAIALIVIVLIIVLIVAGVKKSKKKKSASAAAADSADTDTADNRALVRTSFPAEIANRKSVSSTGSVVCA